MIERTRPARYPAGLNLLQTEYLPMASSHYYAIGASDNNADTIILGLILIVIAVGIIAVGVPWPYGDGNLSFRLRRNQSDKSNDG